MKVRPMTITEKILAKNFGKQEVVPGEIGVAKIDLLMIHTLAALSVLPIFSELERVGGRIWDPGKVVFVENRCMPPGDAKFAEHHKQMKQFRQEHDIKLYDMGRGGICHQVVHEKGHVVPGETILGADSHMPKQARY